MKTLCKIAIILMIMAICNACANDDAITPVDPQYIGNHLIVQYDETFELAHKATKRMSFGVVDFKRCHCGDDKLELWIFEKGIDIEEKKAEAAADPELEGVDFDFTTTIDDPYFDIKEADIIPEDKIVASNDGITIAVIDTGINYDYAGFTAPFLYNSMASDTHETDFGYIDHFGWDFVHQNNNPKDDNGHGTIVSYIITKTLESQGVTDYQLLPIKAFDEAGEGSYFDLLCGFKYALSKPDTDIINLSFGWYDNTIDLFSKFMTEAEEKQILVVASAGNNASNNDNRPHYPSSYPHSNILSIAGMNAELNGLATYSNYGLHSVDMAARSENLIFWIGEDDYVVSGTSFAAAYATASIAQVYVEEMPLLDIMESHIGSPQTAVLDQLSDRIKHAVYILPLEGDLDE